MPTETTTPAPGVIVDGAPYTCVLCGVTFASFATYTRRDAAHNAKRMSLGSIVVPEDEAIDAGEGVDRPERSGSGTGSARPATYLSEKQAEWIARLGAKHPAVASAAELDAAARGSLKKADASKLLDRLFAADKAQPAVAPAAPTPDADVEAWLLGLGRKVEVDEVTPELAQAARNWAVRYNGTFQFMLDMQTDALPGGRWSVGKAKGVLNCWRADLGRRPAPVAPGTPAYEPAKGDVHIVGDDYYRVHIGQRSGRPYAVRAVFHSVAIWGPDGELVEAGDLEWESAPGWINRLSATTLATAEQAHAFGKLAGRCCFCSTPIDTPESTTAGYGPKCASDRGLPWG